MRINEIHGWGPARDVFPTILRKIAYDDPTLDEPKPDPKPKPKKKNIPNKSADEIIATWWPHKRKGTTSDQKEWLQNDNTYKKDIKLLRKKFIAGRKNAAAKKPPSGWYDQNKRPGYPEDWDNKIGSQWKTYRFSKKKFKQEAIKILTNALERYTPPETIPPALKARSGHGIPWTKDRKPDRKTKRPMHLELPS